LSQKEVYGEVYNEVYGLFSFKTGKSEKDGFGTDAQKYIDEVKKALG